MTNASIWVPAVLKPVFLTGEVNGRPVRYRGAYGGRGSGKTRTFAKMAAVWGYRMGHEGREGIILCAREFMNSLEDSSMEEIKQAIREEPFLAAYYEVGEKFIRSRDGRIRFAFVGLSRNVDSIKSKSRILLCWVDEAEAVLEESWAKLLPTVREEGSEVWVTWNPESRRSATNKRFRESPPENAIIVECNWRDNKRFPDVLEAERRGDEANRPDSYGWIWEGEYRVAAEGAYYVRELVAAKKGGRIGLVPPDPDLVVHTAWDLGVGDATAIWLWQAAPGGIRVFDYIEDHGRNLRHYADLLGEKGHEYGYDFVPHDARARELGTGRTRVETLAGLDRKPWLVPIHTVDDGINAVREIFPKCRFDETGCETGIDALREYRTEFDDKKDTFKLRPLHNWASHGADAFRYLAMAYKELTERKRDDRPKPPVNAIPLPPPPEPVDNARIRL